MKLYELVQNLPEELQRKILWMSLETPTGTIMRKFIKYETLIKDYAFDLDMNQYIDMTFYNHLLFTDFFGPFSQTKYNADRLQLVLNNLYIDDSDMDIESDIDEYDED